MILVGEAREQDAPLFARLGRQTQLGDAGLLRQRLSQFTRLLLLLLEELLLEGDLLGLLETHLRRQHVSRIHQRVHLGDLLELDGIHLRGAGGLDLCHVDGLLLASVEAGVLQGLSIYNHLRQEQLLVELLEFCLIGVLNWLQIDRSIAVGTLLISLVGALFHPFR